jgi:hypothetical protein
MGQPLASRQKSTELQGGFLSPSPWFWFGFPDALLSTQKGFPFYGIQSVLAHSVVMGIVPQDVYPTGPLLSFHHLAIHRVPLGLSAHRGEA